MSDAPKKEIILIVSEGCPVCDFLKEKHSGEEGIRILDVGKDQEAMDLAVKLNIKMAPAILLVDGDRKKVCLLNEDKTVKCVEIESNV